MEHLPFVRQRPKHCGHGTDSRQEPCSQQPTISGGRPPSHIHSSSPASHSPAKPLLLIGDRTVFSWVPLRLQCSCFITRPSQLKPHLLKGLLPCSPYLKRQHFLSIEPLSSSLLVCKMVYSKDWMAIYITGFGTVLRTVNCYYYCWNIIKVYVKH